jgi:hypothetical protein
VNFTDPTGHARIPPGRGTRIDISRWSKGAVAALRVGVFGLGGRTSVEENTLSVKPGMSFPVGADFVIAPVASVASNLTVAEAAEMATREIAEETGSTTAIALRPRSTVSRFLERYLSAKQCGEKNLPLIGKLPGGLRLVRTTKGFPIAFRVSDVDVAFGMVLEESGWRQMTTEQIGEWLDAFNAEYGLKMAVHGDLMAGRAAGDTLAMQVPLDEMTTIYFSDAPGMPFYNTTRWLYEAFLGAVPGE